MSRPAVNRFFSRRVIGSSVLANLAHRSWGTQFAVSARTIRGFTFAELADHVLRCMSSRGSPRVKMQRSDRPAGRSSMAQPT